MADWKCIVCGCYLTTREAQVATSSGEFMCPTCQLSHDDRGREQLRADLERVTAERNDALHRLSLAKTIACAAGVSALLGHNCPPTDVADQWEAAARGLRADRDLARSTLAAAEKRAAEAEALVDLARTNSHSLGDVIRQQSEALTSLRSTASKLAAAAKVLLATNAHGVDENGDECPEAKNGPDIGCTCVEGRLSKALARYLAATEAK